MKPRIMYIELKTHPGGHNDAGPARMGRVTFSKTGSTIYYGDKQFQRIRRGGGPCSNYYEINTGDEYWTTIRNQPERKNEAVV